MDFENFTQSKLFFVNQKDRLPKALSDDFIAIDNRTDIDILRQLYAYAQNVKYHNSNVPGEKDWTPFFNDIINNSKTDIDLNKLNKQIQNGEVKPHLALLLSFIKLFKVQQNNLNKITERHLQFYYRDVLGFQPKLGEVGNTTIFLESSKREGDVFIPKGTLFDGGKDINNKKIHYVSFDDFTLNKAKVDNAFILDDKTKIYQLTSKNLSFTPNEFAFNNFGFIISSPLLNVNDGTSIKISLKNIELTKYDIKYTGDKDWINILNINDDSFSITNEIKAYDSQKHGFKFSSHDPMILFSLKPGNKPSNIQNLADIKLQIAVKQGSNFLIQNNYGTVPNQIGVMPFGTYCKQGDSFHIQIQNNDNISISSVAKCLNLTTKEIEKNGNEITLKSNDYNQINNSLRLAECIKNNSNISDFNKIIKPIITLTSPITLDYTINIDSNNFQIFSLSPFEIFELSVLSDNSIFPHLAIDNKNICNEGIYLSIAGIKASTILSIYFRIKSHVMEKNTINWFYLNSKRGWTPFNDVTKDSSKHLSQSGIINLKISDQIIEDCLFIDGEKIWIKASPDTNAESDFIKFESDYFEDIRPNALELSYDENSEGSVDPGVELPIGTITKFENSIIGVKKIEQPYCGEAGFPNESDEKFKCRISEKLRHKGKAWSPWDYERLVLEKFPQIIISKCVPGVDINGNIKAGEVLVIVVPDCNYIHQSDPLQPKIDNNLINEIKEYLSNHASAFASINVRTPSYVNLEIKCTIKLKPGYNDDNYYKSYINDQLIKFIAPWTGDADTNYKNEINEAKIMYFIENLDCVDYIDRIETNLREIDKTEFITSCANHKIDII